MNDLLANACDSSRFKKLKKKSQSNEAIVYNVDYFGEQGGDSCIFKTLQWYHCYIAFYCVYLDDILCYEFGIINLNSIKW